MSILDKINKSSRDFLLNGKLKSDSENNQVYQDKLFLNKFLNSHLVNNEFKKKVSNLYSGFFKANTFNNTSNQEILTDKKVKNNNKDTIQSNENSKLSNINLIIKRKLLIDYIKREDKNKKSINDNFIMRRMNRNFSNNSINFMPEKDGKNSWRILKNKIFGKGESFLERNFSRDFSSTNLNQNKLFSQIPSLRNLKNNHTNKNNDNLSNIKSLKMRLTFY
jgi:hypothetical protein